jgi:hypothetical protein
MSVTITVRRKAYRDLFWEERVAVFPLTSQIDVLTGKLYVRLQYLHIDLPECAFVSS